LHNLFKIKGLKDSKIKKMKTKICDLKFALSAIALAVAV